ncbi:hypothetical protein, partial [Enterobacter kobei]|uniref:hypothetical protein n=1 Tax=Enterobacter kobei TaxID=208224 RepID=UPI003CF66A83
MCFVAPPFVVQQKQTGQGCAPTPRSDGGAGDEKSAAFFDASRPSLSPHALALGDGATGWGEKRLKNKPCSCGWTPHELRAGSLFAGMRKDARKR